MKLPQLYWDRSEFQMFCIGFGCFFAVAMIWHAWVLYDYFRNGPQNWRIARHELTFLVAHPYLFAPAFGILFATANRGLLEGIKILDWRSALLVALLLLVVLICWNNQR